jgi:manganese transport protein
VPHSGLHIRLAAWLRRLSTRLVAIVPALAVSALYGDAATGKLVIFREIVLCLQLPSAVILLLRLTGRQRRRIRRWGATERSRLVYRWASS